jgi:hypothetical protein
MELLLNIQKYITNKYNESTSTKATRLDDDMKSIIYELNKINTPHEQMAEVLDLSLNRIKYEIKQLENKKP